MVAGDIPLALNPSVALTKQPTSIVLHDTRMLGVGRFLQTISSSDAILLALYDGYRSVVDVARVLKSCGWPDPLVKSIEDTTEHFLSLGVLIDASTLGRSSKSQRYDPAMFAFDAHVRPRGSRLEQPIAINFVITRKCGLCCRYCYAGATPQVAEELLPVERVFEVIDEAASLGVSTINLTGGEPFSHPKVFDIVGHILDRRIRPLISTKAFLGRAAVRRLRDMGLQDIQVSLDSSDPGITDHLVGRSGHHRKIIETIKVLVKEGIVVSINSVVTARNIKTLPELACLIADIGVSAMYLSPYVPSLGRNDESLCVGQDDARWLAVKLSDIARLYPGLTLSSGLHTDSKLPTNVEPRESMMPGGGMYCAVGIHGFVILPDGRVTVCERVIERPEFLMGDLKSQSIMEVWRSENWDRVCRPARLLYSGTQCYSCEDFNLCTRQRRRCFVNSLIACGRPFGPEPTCPRVLGDMSRNSLRHRAELTAA